MSKKQRYLIPNAFTFPYFAGLFACFLGTIVLVGWQFDIIFFKSIVPGLTAMNPVVALNFILTGTCLVFLFFTRKRKIKANSILFVLIFFVFGVSSLRLLAYLGHYNSQVDQWLFTNSLNDDNISLHNRMSPQAAIMFCFFSISILRIVIRKGKFCKYQQWGLFAGLIISLFSIFGYVGTQSASLIHLNGYIPISLHAAIGFFILNLGFISLPYNKGFFSAYTSNSIGGDIFRKLIPYAVLIPFFLGWLRVYVVESYNLSPELTFSVLIVLIILILSSIIYIITLQVDKIDIKRKVAENKSKSALIVAENAKKAQQRFLANMSHEIRTPLNAILGFSEVVKNNNLNRETELEYLNYISNSGAILLKLIGDVLEISKIEEGKLELVKESFFFKEAINSAIFPYSFKANEKGLKFELEIDNSIPDCLIGDAHRINQILINLVGNALKFTKEGKVKVSILKIKEDDKSAFLQFEVADTGIGIPEDKQATIFNIFTQSDSTIVREFGGSGLGLSIVRELVILMGGNVKIISPTIKDLTSHGTTFIFTIELEIGRNNKNIEEIDKKLSQDYPLKISVLVVEDNLVNQRLAKAVLKRMVSDIEFAGNGNEAIEKLKNNQYAIVFMDVQMPVMGGYESTRYIRNVLKSEVPIIGLTANVFKEDIENCFKAGMNGYLGKPYGEKQMFDIINKWSLAKPSKDQ